MAGILFDTSVYISALRRGDESILRVRRAARLGGQQTQPLWLSVVVLEELYVGAVDSDTRKELARLEHDFVNVKRLLVPERRDWILAGQILAQLGRKYGFDLVGRARMTNDALIATSAARQGFTVLTENADDYRRIAEIRPFHWEEI